MDKYQEEEAARYFLGKDFWLLHISCNHEPTLLEIFERRLKQFPDSKRPEALIAMRTVVRAEIYSLIEISVGGSYDSAACVKNLQAVNKWINSKTMELGQFPTEKGTKSKFDISKVYAYLYFYLIKANAYPYEPNSNDELFYDKIAAKHQFIDRQNFKNYFLKFKKEVVGEKNRTIGSLSNLNALKQAITLNELKERPSALKIANQELKIIQVNRDNKNRKPTSS